jgi:hypothetical protein
VGIPCGGPRGCADTIDLKLENINNTLDSAVGVDIKSASPHLN